MARLPHGPSCRRLGVDLFCEGMKFDATLPEVVEHGDQVAQAAAQAVKFPDNERIPVLECLEATEQGRVLRRGSQQTLILENGANSGSASVERSAERFSSADRTNG